MNNTVLSESDEKLLYETNQIAIASMEHIMNAAEHDEVYNIKEFATILWSVLRDGSFSSKRNLRFFCEQFDMFYEGMGFDENMRYMRYIIIIKEKIEQVLKETDPTKQIAIAA